MRAAEIKHTMASTPVIIFACAFTLVAVIAGLSDMLNAPPFVTSTLPVSPVWMRPLIDALFVVLAGICATYLVARLVLKRTETEEALHTEKSRLQSLVDSLEYDLTIQDKDYNIIYQNESSRTSSGGNHVGEKCYQVYEGRDKICDGCPVEQAFKDGKSHTTERQRLSPSGEVTFWENTANPIRDSRGNIVSCLEIGRNITERKKTEQALADEATWRRILIDQSRDGIVVLDQDGKVYEANQQFAEMLGYSSEEARQLNVFDWEYLFPREQVLEMIRTVDEAGDHFETQHRRKDGSTFNVEISTNAATFAGQKLVFCVCRDITERKKAEEALIRAEKEKVDILDSMSEIVIFQDLEHRMLWVNKVASESAGLTHEQIIGRYCYEVWSQSNKPCVGCPVAKASQTGQPQEAEIATPDGRTWFIQGHPMRDEKGVIIGLLEVALDVTERKKAEEALRESEEFRASLLANSPNPISVINPDSSLRYVNPALEKLTGFSAAELIDKKAPYPYWTQETLRKTIIGFRKAMRQGDERAEELFQKKNGHRFWVKITSTPVMNNGEFKYLLTNWVDITKRKQVEEALRQSEKKYKNLAEATSDLIWEADERGYFTFVSPKIKDILGYEAKEVIGKIRTLDLIPKAEVKEWLKRFKEINTKREPFFGFEITHLHKNGNSVLFETSGIPNFDSDGNFKGYVGINKNITERKRMEEQLMLTDRLASIGELASGIAHELNNPLTSVLGFSQLLLEEDISPNLKEDIGTIYSEAQRASAIVKNLLTFARKHAPMRQLSQINNILEDVLKLRSYEHKVNNIELEKRFAADLPEIMVDYFQMQQVFLNLIVNAESAMLEAHGRGKMVITTARNNHAVKVSIADNGPGIAKENLRRVFDPFFTTKEVGKGTGLGLSICHGIVTGHGGRIYAEGAVSEGATFIVELPLDGNSGARRQKHGKR
jgi:two-component system NtrC family sensor kinase